MNEISLQPDLGIEHVEALRATLAPLLNRAGMLALTGDRVERVHTAGLQLLHAFIRDRANAGHGTTITLASPALMDAARVLALTDMLGLGAPVGTAGDLENTGDPA
ncbi:MULTISPECIES: STAS domain-containing protein [unclassified Lysobacter]